MQPVFRLIPVFALVLSGSAGLTAEQSMRPKARPDSSTVAEAATPEPAALDAIRPQERPAPLGLAIAAAGNGEWTRAQALVAAQDPAIRDVIDWMRLRAGRGSFAEVQDFLSRRSDWPDLARIRSRNESNVLRQPRDMLLSVFDAHAPTRPAAILAYARAMSDVGRNEEARKLIVQTWRGADLSEAEQALFLAEHGGLLKDHHTARLDALLWDREYSAARRMFSLVSDEEKAVANVRIALLRRSGNANALLDTLTDAQRETPGISQARFEWRVRAGNWADAKTLLLEHSLSKDKLGNPSAWARRREELARDELRDGKAARAYQMAARNHLSGGSAYAALEWLAGYIALTKLDDPATALKHFENHDSAVSSPISKGRAGYWKGRAHREMGNAALADMEFTKGAGFQTSFYGLLAAEAAGLPFDVGLESAPTIAWQDSAVARDSLFIAGRALAEAGQRNLAERFWRHLADQLDAEDAALLGDAALDLGEPHLAVIIGKTVARRGVIVPKPYYPLHPLVDQNLPIATEMALAIARRESEFDPVVRSGAGALGLMQLMPATAREVAGQLGLSAQHSTGRLTRDPSYNAVLGSRYLSGLAEQFDGNVIMMSAGYNAGPSRPVRWMGLYGDPRGGDVETMIDWIENIPFSETRNYVMRVSESLPIYRARLGHDPLPIPFSAEITGSTLKSNRD